MSRSASRRSALAALVALAIYCLACWYPGAWSPDSKKVVLPVFAKDGVARLVMVDLDAKPVREVARIDGKDSTLSAAAWSPDGQWLAYMTFRKQPPPPAPADKKAKKPPRPVDVTLVVQDAATGRSRTIWSARISDDKKALQPNELFGPGWSSDSRLLIAYNMSPKAPALLMLDTNGRIQRQVALPDRAWAINASLSPDGRHLAYVAKPPKGSRNQPSLMLREIGGGEPRDLGIIGDYDSPDGPTLYPRPVWSSDAHALFFAQADDVKSDKAVGVVKRFDPRTGQTKIVWQRRRSSPVGLSLSAKSDRLAIDYMFKTKRKKGAVGIDVVNLATGQVMPIHLAMMGTHHYSTSISPDGRWVALCPFSDRAKTSLGLILASDGTSPRFFLPGPRARDLVRRVVCARLLALSQFDPTDQDKLAPIFKELADWGPAARGIETVEKAGPDKRDEQARQARQLLDAARRAQPDHPFGPALEAELKRVLAPPTKKPGKKK